MDIRSGRPGAAGILSNLTRELFIFDGIEVSSSEAVLMAFKVSDWDLAQRLLGLHGLAPKKEVASFLCNGLIGDWRETQTLYWRGSPVDRHGDDYKTLVRSLFLAKATAKDFRQALISTRGQTLTHRSGGRDPNQTVLTEKEFCSALMHVRHLLVKEAHLSSPTQSSPEDYLRLSSG